MLSFSESTGDKPIIHDLIKRFDICINIIKAEMAPGLAGSMLAEFSAPEGDIAQALEFLAAQGVGTALIIRHSKTTTIFRDISRFSLEKTTKIGGEKGRLN